MLLNSLHSLTNVSLYFWSSSAIVNWLNKQVAHGGKFEMKITSFAYKFKMATRQNLTRMKSCCLPIGWYFLIVLQYGQNKVNAQEGVEGQGEMGSLIQGGQEGPGREGMEAPSLIHHQSTAKEPSPMREEEKKQMEETEKWVEEAGGCGQVTVIITNPTVCPDGCRGWAIYIRSGGASQEEAPTDCGRQIPLEGIPPGW